MTEISDTLTEDEREKIEEAKQEAKRNKTKYGSLISEDNDE